MPGRVQLYLVRHAIAEERGEAWPDDRLRPLSRDGVLRLRKQAAGLVALGVTFDEILTSPLVRTRQTADLLKEALPARPKVIEFPPLAPGGKPRDVLQGLKAHARRTSLALVGHEPDMGELAAALIGLRTPLTFKKGAVALVEVALLPPPAGSGELQWFLAPRILRRLGGR